MLKLVDAPSHALHAIAAFGPDVPEEVIRALVEVVDHGEARSRAAASAALELVRSDAVLRTLVGAAQRPEGARPWVLATLGRLDPVTVRAALAGNPLLAKVEPLLVLGPAENWLARGEAAADLRFLLQKDMV